MSKSNPGKAKAMEAAALAVDPRLVKARNIYNERERTRQGTATPERIVKAEDGFEKNVGKEGVQRINEAPLDRLWQRGAIMRSEFEAGDKFRGDAYLAAVDPATMSVDWNKAGGGGRSSFIPSMFASQHIYDARTRFREIERTFRGLLWDILQDGLIHEHSLEQIGHTHFGRSNRREAAVAGQAGFRAALSALADRYAGGFVRIQMRPSRELSPAENIEIAARAICEADPLSPGPDAPIMIGPKRAKAWQARAPIVKQAIDMGLFAWPAKARLVGANDDGR